MKQLLFFLLCGLVAFGNRSVVGEEITLANQFRTAESVYAIKLISSRKPDRAKQVRGQTTYEIVKPLVETKATRKLGETIEMRYFEDGSIGDSFLYFDQSEAKYSRDWKYLARMDLSDLGYLTESPTEKTTDADRLSYYMKFLIHSNAEIAYDAIVELGCISLSVITAHKETLNPEILRKCIRIHQSEISDQVTLYPTLLGLCGTDDDAKMFEAEIVREYRVDEEFRLVSGFMTGYLLLRHEPGLKFLEDHKLLKQERFSERYAVMQSLRFMWLYGEDRISKDRLRQSMRIYLDMPEFTDLAIVDLGRWEDWSISDRLMKLYGKPEYDNPNIKRAIIRFYLTAEATKPKDANEPLPAHVVTAQRHLKSLREKDPETVKTAEEFFLMPKEMPSK